LPALGVHAAWSLDEIDAADAGGAVAVRLVASESSPTGRWTSTWVTVHDPSVLGHDATIVRLVSDSSLDDALTSTGYGLVARHMSAAARPVASSPSPPRR
jgi:hypothetical protein